jgi:hypothetical protein
MALAGHEAGYDGSSALRNLVQLVSSSVGPRVKTIVTTAASKVHTITQ